MKIQFPQSQNILSLHKSKDYLANMVTGDEVKAEKQVRQEKQENDNDEPSSKRLKSDNRFNDLYEKVSKQIDYYFSDVNVVKDKFLLAEFERQDGWVDLKTLLKFKKLRELTEKEDVVIDALKECNSDVIELDASEKRVRRKNPIPSKDYLSSLDSRTVHISGFPTEYGFEFLRQYCSQFGVVESLAMRRHFRTRFFKGCIHVVFKEEADAKKVLDTEVLKCKDRELRKESMTEYRKRKEEQTKNKIEQRKEQKSKNKKTNKSSS